MKPLRVAVVARLVVVALLAGWSAGAAPAADPPFEASGWDRASIDEVWSSHGDAGRRFASKEFAVGETLALVVGGYPGRDGIVLALERIPGGERLALDAPTVGHAWHLVSFSIPRPWVGARVRIVAGAPEGSPWWIGATSPVDAKGRGIADAEVPLLALLAIAAFLLPGLAAVAIARDSIEPWARAAVVVVAGALAGYAAFYAWFLSPEAGAATSVGLIVLSAGVVVSQARRGAEAILASRALVEPLALMSLYAIAVACLTFVYLPDWPDADEVPRHRYVRDLPGDNGLPQFLAENMWNGADARQVIDGWQSSDRPPLQAGLVLMQRTFAEPTGASPSLAAQMTGIVAQSTWVVGVWALCAALGLTRRATAIALAGGALSGFFLLNTAYVWPKMLAGALALVALAALLAARRDGWTRPRTLLAMAGACLALLSHAGAAFTLLPALLVLVLPRPWPSWRDVALAATLAASLLAPWLLYQKLYAPPGNRLLMTNVAGEVAPTGQTFSEALASNYGRIGADAALRGRWTNAQLLVPDLAPRALSSDAVRRTNAWNRVFGTPGVLSVAWLLLLLRVVRRERTPSDVRRLWVLTLASVALPVLVLFGPREATAHTSSYAAIATLFVLAARELDALPRRWIAALLALQGALFAVDWIVLTPPGVGDAALPVASTPLAVVALAAGAALLALVARVAARDGGTYS